ncbi:MAG: hypothetical protein IPN17_31670 [Deltaproteobacteria bacterium]|nr:hypothetical protein [Deltaproteobacteria bacterium]
MNYNGQLGVDSRVANAGLEIVEVPGIDDAVELSAGAAFTCALRRTGHVVCWGDNTYGQRGLGFAGTTISSGPGPEATELGDVLSIESGAEFTCALKTNGTVSCWGRNDYGQSGPSKSRILPSPSRLSLTGVVELTAGYQHACARDRLESTVCWGSNGNGQLGSDAGIVGTSSSQPRSVSGEHRFVEIRGGGGFTCGRTVDAAWCWGQNFFQQLGDGSDIDQWLPTRMAWSGTVINISPGASHVCAQTPGGGVVCWGRSDSGQTGHGSVEGPSPAIVDGLTGVVGLALGSTLVRVT